MFVPLCLHCVYALFLLLCRHPRAKLFAVDNLLLIYVAVAAIVVAAVVVGAIVAAVVVALAVRQQKELEGTVVIDGKVKSRDEGVK